MVIRFKKTRLARAVAFGLGAMASAASMADSISFDNGLNVDYKFTMNYALAMRMKEPAKELIDGPVDPFVAHPPNPPDQPFPSFGHTGLPTTINFDDGDRNFKKHSLVNNRVSAYTEWNATWKSFGAVVSADAFYDEAYHRHNDNNSPDTYNQTRETGWPRKFHPSAEYYGGGPRARLLDGYIYGDFPIGSMQLNVRAGRQVVAWGESLFLYGIALSQGRADATRAFVPGAEIKEILLPTEQVAFSLAATQDLTLLGYYKLRYLPTEIFPSGHYLSPADVVGPGSEFVYGSGNPAFAEECPGLLNVPGVGDFSFLCMQGGIGGVLLNAPRTINVTRGKDILPDDDGQYGLGFTYQITPITNVGFYRLKYHDPNPAVQLNMGYAKFGELPGGIPITSELIQQVVPVTYNVKYWGDIDMSAISWTSVLGGINVAGEFAYRQGQDVQVQAHISDVLSPVYTRGDIAQAQISALYAANPQFFYDDIALVAEAAYFKLVDVDPIEAQPGIVPVGKGDVPFNDKVSYGIQTLALAKKRDVMAGWDFTTNASLGSIIKGQPPMSAAFGALYGEDDTRFSLGVGLQYLQNMEFNVGYNWFFGDPGKKIGKSSIPALPFQDRDYATFNVKYSF